MGRTGACGGMALRRLRVRAERVLKARIEQRALGLNHIYHAAVLRLMHQIAVPSRVYSWLATAQRVGAR